MEENERLIVFVFLGKRENRIQQVEEILELDMFEGVCRR